MKLYVSATSPYARIAAAAVIEKGLQDRVERVVVDPWSGSPDLLEVSPLSRVPVLVTDAGVALTESLLIADYLDRRFPARPLLPERGLEQALHKAGLGHGLLDSATYVIGGRRFGAAEDPLRERRLAAIRRSLPALAAALTVAMPYPDLGDLVVGAALGYLDLRLPELDWRQPHPALSRWYEHTAARPSMLETRPA